MISPAQWAVFRSGVSTVVGQAWAKVLPTFAEKFATRIPSDSTQEVHAWTGKLPKMRQWLGQRVTFEVAPATYVLVNQVFEATLGFDLFDLDDDKMGVYYRALPDMAEQAKYQPDYMFRDLLENTGDQTGPRQNGLDGLAGFYNGPPHRPVQHGRHGPHVRRRQLLDVHERHDRRRRQRHRPQGQRHHDHADGRWRVRSNRALHHLVVHGQASR